MLGYALIEVGRKSGEKKPVGKRKWLENRAHLLGSVIGHCDYLSTVLLFE